MFLGYTEGLQALDCQRWTTYSRNHASYPVSKLDGKRVEITRTGCTFRSLDLEILRVTSHVHLLSERATVGGDSLVLAKIPVASGD
jgi:hypothetical protein